MVELAVHTLIEFLIELKLRLNVLFELDKYFIEAINESSGKISLDYVRLQGRK